MVEETSPFLLIDDGYGFDTKNYFRFIGVSFVSQTKYKNKKNTLPKIKKMS